MDVRTADGDLSSREKPQPDEATKPLLGCATLLRVELEPIEAGEGNPKASAGPDAPKVKAAEQTACQPGFVRSNGKCAAEASDPPHVCAPDDRADCQKQCDKGNGESCNNLAVLPYKDAAPGPFEATFQKGCDAGSADACMNLGVLRLHGLGGTSRNPAAGVRLLEKACEQGSEAACFEEGNAYWLGTMGVPKDVRRGIRLLARACDGGSQDACTNRARRTSGWPAT